VFGLNGSEMGKQILPFDLIADQFGARCRYRIYRGTANS
jgi:hypothetical protein